MMTKVLSDQAGYPLAAKLQYRDVKKFLDHIEWSVNHTATLIRSYALLVKLAPTEEQADEVNAMMQQEKQQFTLLEALYKELIGGEPAVQPKAQEFTTYKEGLRRIVSLERTAIRQYRDTYLLTPSLRVRDLFFYALSDGTDHMVGLMLLQQGQE
jgi:rubrerythrin